MTRRLFIFINGIRTDAADMFAWPNRAEEWVGSNTDDDSACFRYESYVRTRWLTVGRDAGRLAEYVNRWFYAGRDFGDIILVGHSNGCELIRRLLVEYDITVREVHMIAAAVDPDFERNGLNRALSYPLNQLRVTRLCVYASPDDAILGAAGVTRWLPGAMRYGQLGRVGPQNVAGQVASKVRTIRCPGYGHSDWFSDAHLDATMRLVTGKVAA